MAFADIVKKEIRNFRAHAIGRVALSLGVIVVSALGSAMGFGLLPAAIVAASGAVLFNGMVRLKEQRAYENDMLDLYRNEIAHDLGRAPESLTRADLMEAAKTNDVLGQALQRQNHKTTIAVASELLSAVATVASIGVFGAVSELKNLVTKTFGYFAAYFVGIGTISGISGLVLQNGVEALVGQATGVSKASAHDRIFEMQRGLNNGNAVTPEKVYGVLVAGEPKLCASIAKQFHHPYAKMTSLQQKSVIEQMGVTEVITDLANQINSGVTTPGKLAYLMGDEHHQLRQAVKKQAEEKHEKPIQNVTTKGFVERLGLVSRANASHQSRVDIDRANASLAQVGG